MGIEVIASTRYTSATIRPHYHWTDAARTIRDHNNPSRPLSTAELAALQRLRELGQLSHWRPDMMMKVILDLDVLFFKEMLRKNIAIRWVIRPHRPALAYCSAPEEKKRRTTISFNIPHLIQSERTANEALMVVIHEMCHAILFVLCGPKKDVATVDRVPWNLDKGHSTSFEMIMASVQARLGRTRYCHLTKKAGQLGGTVARGTPLDSYWRVAGGYRASDKHERHNEKALQQASSNQERRLWANFVDGINRDWRR